MTEDITPEQKAKYIKILQEYRDKSYICNILCQKSYDFNNILKQMINIPLILSSAVMGVLNSNSFNPEDLQIANIILNTSTGLILSLIGNFKITEKVADFKNNAIKFNKLCH